MSGQQVTMSGPLNATRRAETWLSALGLTRNRAGEAARLPVERLLEAAGERDPVLGYGGLYFGPVLDERTHVRHPFFPDAPGQSAGIPMIIGNTHDETRAFNAGDASLWSLTWDDLPARLSPDQMRLDVAPEVVIAEYRRLYPSYSPSEVFFAATTAGRSWRAAVIEAEERARQGSPAFVYQLDWASDFEGGRLGAPHTGDIRLVFKTLEVGAWPATGPGADAASSALSRAFASLARSGDPNHAGLPAWEPYDLTRRQTMIIDHPPRMEDDPRGAERRFFARIPYVQPGT
jgi:para-nitrobenzyl esterase